jgi:uncharacterized hydantoinase/oxoprolinase family protein
MTIVSPDARIMVSVLGADPDSIRVVDARRSHSDTDLVRVEIGEVHFAGPLRLMVAVIERAALGLMQVEQARNGRDL